MGANKDSISAEIDFSSLSPSNDYWASYLATVFLIVFLLRLARALGIVNRIHSLLILVCTVSTVSGRRRRADRLRLINEIKELRTNLKTVSVTEHFAKYSRLERRLKAVSRELSQLAPETFATSLIRVVSISLSIFILEGVFAAWLIGRSPKEVVTQSILNYVELQAPAWLPLLHAFSYVPPKLVVITWISLCYYIATHLSALCVQCVSPARGSQLDNDLNYESDFVATG